MLKDVDLRLKAASLSAEMSAKEYHLDDVPGPDELLQEAAEEVDRSSRLVRLSDYVDTIKLLRDKGCSWRKIADFFQEKGIDANHNEIYYVARKAALANPTADRDELQVMEHEKKDEDRDAEPWR